MWTQLPKPLLELVGANLHTDDFFHAMKQVCTAWTCLQYIPFALRGLTSISSRQLPANANLRHVRTMQSDGLPLAGFEKFHRHVAGLVVLELDGLVNNDVFGMFTNLSCLRHCSLKFVATAAVYNQHVKSLESLETIYLERLAFTPTTWEGFASTTVTSMTLKRCEFIQRTATGVLFAAFMACPNLAHLDAFSKELCGAASDVLITGHVERDGSEICGVLARCVALTSVVLSVFIEPSVFVHYLRNNRRLRALDLLAHDDDAVLSCIAGTHIEHLNVRGFYSSLHPLLGTCVRLCSLQLQTVCLSSLGDVLCLRPLPHLLIFALHAPFEKCPDELIQALACTKTLVKIKLSLATSAKQQESLYSNLLHLADLVVVCDDDERWWSVARDGKRRNAADAFMFKYNRVRQIGNVWSFIDV